MRTLISALAVAGLVAIALPAYAEAKTNPTPTKPSRAADGTVKNNPSNLSKPGRQVDDTTKSTTTIKKKHYDGAKGIIDSMGQ